MCSDFPSPFSSSNSHLSLSTIVPEVKVSVCVSVCTSTCICNLEGVHLRLWSFCELISIMKTSSHHASLPFPPPSAKLLFCTSVATGSCFLLYPEETRGLQWESKRFPVLTKYRCSGNGGLMWLTYRELLSYNTMSCVGGPAHSSLSPSLPDSKCPLE